MNAARTPRHPAAWTETVVELIRRTSTELPDDIMTAITRAAAMTGPSRDQVSRMLSTPVCGVEARKLTVAPLLAPSRRSEKASGNTPHEQSGSGTPSSAALTTCPRPRPPR